MHKLKKLVFEQTDILKKSQTDSARLSAEVLLAFALGIESNELRKLLITDPDLRIEKNILEKYLNLIERRTKGEPLAYICGSKEFYGRDFRVSPAVLIPRPETELLIELCIEKATKLSQSKKNKKDADTHKAKENLVFADLGTGSGCIAISLCLELPEWKGLALDLSGAAVKIAQQNKEILQAKNCKIIRADFSSLPLAPATIDLLVSNPPYISSAEYLGLDREVKSFEPKSALVPDPEKNQGLHSDKNLLAKSGHIINKAYPPKNKSALNLNKRPTPLLNPNVRRSGLEAFESIAASSYVVLRSGGYLLLEMGCTQGEDLKAIVKAQGFMEIEIINDLSGLQRILVAKKPL